MAKQPERERIIEEMIEAFEELNMGRASMFRAYAEAALNVIERPSKPSTLLAAAREVSIVAKKGNTEGS